jgi:hypothetical protein
MKISERIEKEAAFKGREKCNLRYPEKKDEPVSAISGCKIDKKKLIARIGSVEQYKRLKHRGALRFYSDKLIYMGSVPEQYRPDHR